MKTLWVEQIIKYDGTQLRSLYAYLNHLTQGDSIIAWRGPCDISLDNMVDGEDQLERAIIAGSEMLHFIVELFNRDLPFAVATQRLLAALALENLRGSLSADDAKRFFRHGDDLYLEDRKLSISIATVSPVSALVHFAVNISNVGTPVKTCALRDFQVESKNFAEKLMAAFQDEMQTLVVATQKVHWVR